MKPEVLDTLSEARDFCSLTRAVLAMCEPYGPVHSFRLVHNPGAARVACTIELQSAKHEAALARSLGARVSGGVYLDIPVRRDFARGRKPQAAVADHRVSQPPARSFSSLQVSG